MTERGEQAIAIQQHAFQIGPSSLEWDGAALVVNINEKTAPIPAELRGRMRVEPAFLNEKEFKIDDAGRHRWRPVAPEARIHVDFDKPSLNWSGRGYLDMNTGDEPLESAFKYWDWSRAALPGSETAILYNTDMWNGDSLSRALRFRKNGECEEFESPPFRRLPSTLIWRMPRSTRADARADAVVVRTLEDTPFYSRSIIDTKILGQRCQSMHESLSGGRLRSAIVQWMLKYRMPRIEQ